MPEIHSTDGGIAALRSEMNTRLTGVEKWLERVTTAVEKLAEYRERLMVLEVRVNAEIEHIQRDLEQIRSDFADVRAAVESLARDNDRQEVSIARLDMAKGGAIAVATAALTTLAGILSRSFGGSP